MSKAIPVIFNSFYQANIGVRVYVDPGANAYPTYWTTAKANAPANWALVLDRKNPKQAPLFEGSLSSNTDVPQALADAVSEESILFFSCLGGLQAVPQGALFKFLHANGAGAEILKLESFAHFNGCGMQGMMAYNLVSVPGSGVAGIEKSALMGSTFRTLLSLVPSASGYVPIEVGTS